MVLRHFVMFLKNEFISVILIKRNLCKIESLVDGFLTES